MTSRKRPGKRTPIRTALLDDSPLHREVEDGVAALESVHRKCLATDIRSHFGDSLNLDSSLRSTHPEDSRWDYLLGHSQTRKLVGIEPHAAKSDQVSVVIRKRIAAREQLEAHLKPGRRVEKWLWVASGKV